MGQLSELSDDDVALVKGMLARGDKQVDIAALVGVAQGNVSRVKAMGDRFRPAVKPLPPDECAQKITSRKQADSADYAYSGQIGGHNVLHGCTKPLGDLMDTVAVIGQSTTMLVPSKRSELRLTVSRLHAYTPHERGALHILPGDLGDEVDKRFGHLKLSQRLYATSVELSEYIEAKERDYA